MPGFEPGAFYARQAVIQTEWRGRSSARSRLTASPRTTEDLHLEREDRDRLLAEFSRVSPENGRKVVAYPAIEQVYLQALRAGDRRTVRALENASPAFPLLSAAAVKHGEQIKIAASPLAHTVRDLEAVDASYSHVLTAMLLLVGTE